MAFSLIPTAVSSSRMDLWLAFLRREGSVLRHLHPEANSTRHCRLAGTQPRAWQCQPGAELMNHSSISVTQPRAQCPGLASANTPRCRAPAVFSAAWTRLCSGKASGAGLPLLSSPHLPRKQVCKLARAEEVTALLLSHMRFSKLQSTRALPVTGRSPAACLCHPCHCVAATASLACSDTS